MGDDTLVIVKHYNILLPLESFDSSITKWFSNDKVELFLVPYSELKPRQRKFLNDIAGGSISFFDGDLYKQYLEILQQYKLIEDGYFTASIVRVILFSVYR